MRKTWRRRATNRHRISGGDHETYSALLADFDPDQLDTRELALAFWNNAYNYFMVQKLLTDPGGRY